MDDGGYRSTGPPSFNRCDDSTAANDGRVFGNAGSEGTEGRDGSWKGDGILRVYIVLCDSVTGGFPTRVELFVRKRIWERRGPREREKREGPRQGE